MPIKKKLLKSKPKGITRIDTVAVQFPMYPDSGDVEIVFMDDFLGERIYELHISFSGYCQWFQIIDGEE